MYFENEENLQRLIVLVSLGRHRDEVVGTVGSGGGGGSQRGSGHRRRRGAVGSAGRWFRHLVQLPSPGGSSGSSSCSDCLQTRVQYCNTGPKLGPSANRVSPQADVCHAYQILHAHGVPDDHIIVMMTDDIANNKM